MSGSCSNATKRSETIGALYSSAFLLEREGRIADAIEAWRSIIEWAEERGNTLDTEWPKREVERLSATHKLGNPRSAPSSASDGAASPT